MVSLSICIVAVALLPTWVAVGWACDAVVVGRLASADGSVLLGDNEENALGQVLQFCNIPRLRAAGMVDLGCCGQLDPVPETWAFLWSENPGLECSDGYLNDWGVAVASIKYDSREGGYDSLVAHGEIRSGLGYILCRLVSHRAHSARDPLTFAPMPEGVAVKLRHVVADDVAGCLAGDDGLAEHRTHFC